MSKINCVVHCRADNDVVQTTHKPSINDRSALLFTRPASYLIKLIFSTSSPRKKSSSKFLAALKSSFVSNKSPWNNIIGLLLYFTTQSRLRVVCTSDGLHNTTHTAYTQFMDGFEGGARNVELKHVEHRAVECAAQDLSEGNTCKCNSTQTKYQIARPFLTVRPKRKQATVVRTRQELDRRRIVKWPNNVLLEEQHRVRIFQLVLRLQNQLLRHEQ